jgi:hypothetical protein
MEDCVVKMREPEAFVFSASQEKVCCSRRVAVSGIYKLVAL